MLDFFDNIDTKSLMFNTSEQFINKISKLLDEQEKWVKHITVGQSREGRTIHGFRAGNGSEKIALLAGAHSDEPVGPQMLRLFLEQLLKTSSNVKSLLQRYTFIIIPHINPDGEQKNWSWIKQWPDAGAYIKHAFREEPGEDLEFGYPDMRIENRAVSSFLEQFSPYRLYINFHGMGFAEGIMLLIERGWIDDTEILREQFRHLAADNELPLHDHDRKGEKGFRYIGPGFTTTPEGRAMQQHFRQKGEDETASKFHLSSMEFVQELGGHPLCLVTELPLFLISSLNINNAEKGIPKTYLAFKEKLPELRRRLMNYEPIQPITKNFDITPIPLSTAVRIQLQIIKSALHTVDDSQD